MGKNPRRNTGTGTPLHVGPEEYLYKATHDAEGEVIVDEGKSRPRAASVSMTLDAAEAMKLSNALRDAIATLTDDYNKIIITGYYAPVKSKAPRLE